MSTTQTLTLLQGYTMPTNAYNNPTKRVLYNYTSPHFRPNPDETDNKTTNDWATFDRLAMNDIFRAEFERLKTFDRWPLNFIDKNVLAQTGMFFTHDGDKVKCYFCEVEIGRWEETDHPVNEHIKWSPNCPLLRRRTTNNIPINVEALERILPPVSYDVCGSNEAVEVRPTAYAEGTISSSSSTFGVASPMAGSSVSNAYTMEYPEYAIESARCRSFAEWPRTMRQKPKELAEAGFFYAGIGDRVNCFSCGGGLKDWDENDEPWEQHALWLSKCRYLKLIKGQAYIDAVIAKNKMAAEKSQEALNGGTSDVEVQECGTQTEGQQQQNSCLATKTATASSTEVKTTAIGFEKDLLQRSDSSSSSSDKKIIPEEKLCKICYAAEYNTAFLPCGHVVACAKCASSVTKCPMCRKPFRDVMRVYFS